DTPCVKICSVNLEGFHKFQQITFFKAKESRDSSAIALRLRQRFDDNASAMAINGFVRELTLLFLWRSDPQDQPRELSRPAARTRDDARSGSRASDFSRSRRLVIAVRVGRSSRADMPAAIGAVAAKLKGLQIDACPFANLPERKRTQWALTREEMKNCV